MNSATDPSPLAGGPALRWLAVWRRNLRVWYKLFGPALLGNFGEPLLYLLALGYGLGGLVGRIDGLSYLAFLASGIAVSSTMTTASFEGMFSAYTRMEVQKTWEAMRTAPLEVTDIVVGEAVWAATKSLFSGAAIVLVAAGLGAVSGWQAVLALPVMLLAGLCFAALALVVTSFATNYDFFLYYNTLVVMPMLLLSGVFFPLERMPEIIQWLALALPLSHAVDLVRPLLTGQPLAWPLLHLLVLAAYTAAGLALAVALLRRRLTA
ncbi:MAG: ABC transporter permease [Pseudomonadota bacterium]|nr:ABC transporter permease [Pseudomonadota bacterium]